MSICLNIGSGSGDDLQAGWVNVDIQSGPGVDLVADCRELPYEDGTITAIRSSHMVEHLSKPELLEFAHECHRVLMPGGTLEIIAPDLPQIVATYWRCQTGESMECEDFPISPLDWLDNLLYSRQVNNQDFHRQGIYEQKLLRVFSRFQLHSFEHRSRPVSRFEIRMGCQKPDRYLASVVLSTRNKARFLDVTLQSIFAQHVPFPFEVIVVDDGSTDETKAVCRKHGATYIYVENDRYRNPSFARNVGYRAATGDVIIAQSDDTVHRSPNAIERLATNLKRGEFLLAKVENWKYADGQPQELVATYCAPTVQRPYFFLGSLWREDLYAAGGCDEEFVEPCYDDNWFADCLVSGLGLGVRYTDSVLAHHQSHTHEPHAHDNEHLSRMLYAQKVNAARASGQWVASGGPWPYTARKPLVIPKQAKPFVQPRLKRIGTIPLVFHYFWHGPLTWMRYMTLASCRYYHPDYQIVVHKMAIEGAATKQWSSTETLDSDTYHGVDHWPLVAGLGVEVREWLAPYPDLSPSHACDLGQWETLYTEGGYYADMDILWAGRLPTADPTTSAIFCLSQGFMAIGLVGASPELPLFREISRMSRENYAADKYQSTGAEAIYRLAGIWPNWPSYDQPGLRAMVELRGRNPQAQIVELPDVTVYPWGYQHTDMIFGRAEQVPDGCCGIHWFGGNNLSQQWNHMLTAENFREHRNTYTLYAAEVVAGMSRRT